MERKKHFASEAAKINEAYYLLQEKIGVRAAENFIYERRIIKHGDHLITFKQAAVLGLADKLMAWTLAYIPCDVLKNECIGEHHDVIQTGNKTASKT